MITYSIHEYRRFINGVELEFKFTMPRSVKIALAAYWAVATVFGMAVHGGHL